MMKKIISIIILCLLMTSCSKKEVTIRYSLYEHLPDIDYYRQIVEDKWYSIHPDIKLEYVSYDCYDEDPKEDVDVIMYDAMCESYLIKHDFIRPIEEEDIDDINDFFEFTIDDIRDNDILYGIPAMLCTRVFFYDVTNQIVSDADSVYDLASLSEEILINVDDDRYTYYLEVMADSNEEYDTSEKTDEELLNKLEYIRQLANKEYLEASANDLADAYDDGIGYGFFGYTECLVRLDDRKDTTETKLLSFGDDENVSLFYCDVVSLTNYVQKDEEDLCVELMNIISSADVMDQACLDEDGYNRLLFPRSSFYESKQDDKIYSLLYSLIKENKGSIIRQPASEFE